MIEKLHDAGLRSEHAYVAGFASIGLSFLAWATSLRAEKAGTDRADRWGIFVGHWAPTFSAWAMPCAATRSNRGAWATTGSPRMSTRQPVNCLPISATSAIFPATSRP